MDSLNARLTQVEADSTKAAIHLELVDIHRRSKAYDKAYFHVQQYKATTALIAEKESTRLLTNAEEKYRADQANVAAEVTSKKGDYQEQVNYLTENDKTITQDQSTLIIILGTVAVILFLAIVLFLRVSRKRNKPKKALQKSQLETAELEERTANADLEHKSKALKARMLNIIRRSDAVTALKQKIEEVNTSSDTKQNKEFEQLLSVVDAQVDIEKDWENFYEYFEESNSDFFEKMKKKFPDLNTAQLRLCAVVRLKLEVDDAAKILRLEPNSVRVARTRLRQKMDLPPDMNLEGFMKDF